MSAEEARCRRAQQPVLIECRLSATADKTVLVDYHPIQIHSRIHTSLLLLTLLRPIKIKNLLYQLLQEFQPSNYWRGI